MPLKMGKKQHIFGSQANAKAYGAFAKMRHYYLQHVVDHLIADCNYPRRIGLELKE